MKKNIIKVTQSITIINHDSESPYSVTKIIKSENGNLYHVISEMKNSHDCNFKIMKNIELIDYFGLEGNEIPNAHANICITKSEILQYSNDADLGDYVRKKIF